MHNAQHGVQADRGVFVTRVVANDALCDEHFRLRLSCDTFPEARVGQFVQLLCHRPGDGDPSIHVHDWTGAPWPIAQATTNTQRVSMLRRAFSIADLERDAGGVTLDVIHRVVGVGTRWLAGLGPGDAVSVLGPLGGGTFTISETRTHAYLVSGGVGFPPMIWLAKELTAAGKRVVSFFGAQTERLVPLALPSGVRLSDDATWATADVSPFGEAGVPVVVSTDDGSVGLRGWVTDAMNRYDEANPVDPSELVVYTCGPEPMMKAVATWCARRDIDCQVCMERNMACGMGTCQSCVVPCREGKLDDAWRYRLCCSDGPVFDRRVLVW